MEQSAWHSCEAQLAEDAPQEETPPPVSKYVLSLLTVVAVVVLLWLLRPPFACEEAKGVHLPQLLIGRVIGIAILAGCIVLFAPYIAKSSTALRRMVSK